MGFGPLPFGLFSDRCGRRRTLLVACAMFVVGAIACVFAPSLTLMKAARVVCGLDAAGLRVASTAMIRDRHSGASMAREIAFAMTGFMLVPIFAPLLGAGLIKVLPWRSVFMVCAIFGVALAAWSMRMGETLPVDQRQPLDIRQVWVATKAIVASPSALAYTLAMLPLFGAFPSYLASSERIVDLVLFGSQRAAHRGGAPDFLGVDHVHRGVCDRIGALAGHDGEDGEVYTHRFPGLGPDRPDAGYLGATESTTRRAAVITAA